MYYLCASHFHSGSPVSLYKKMIITPLYLWHNCYQNRILWPLIEELWNVCKCKVALYYSCYYFIKLYHICLYMVIHTCLLQTNSHKFNSTVNVYMPTAGLTDLLGCLMSQRWGTGMWMWLFEKNLKVPEEMENSNPPKPYKPAPTLSLQLEWMPSRMPCGPKKSH